MCRSGMGTSYLLVQSTTVITAKVTPIEIIANNVPVTFRLTSGDVIHGFGIVGTNAGDLISEVMLAIEMGADAADIGLTIHPHPT